MAILDIFKNKKEQPKKKAVVKKEVKKDEKVQKEAVTLAPVQKKEVNKDKKSLSQVYDVVSKPHISEKATTLGENSQYTFDVYQGANKNRVKDAVQRIYNVDVLSVNIINIPGKRRRLGRSIGFKKGYKKAIVTIKKDQKIEII